MGEVGNVSGDDWSPVDDIQFSGSVQLNKIKSVVANELFINECISEGSSGNEACVEMVFNMFDIVHETTRWVTSKLLSNINKSETEKPPIENVN